MPRPNRKQNFLACYRELGDVWKACKAAGIDSRQTHYRWLTDEQYRQDFALAQRDYEQISARRNIENVRKLADQTRNLALADQAERLSAMNERWNGARQAVTRITLERGAEMATVPGGKSGFLCRDYRGKDCTGEVYRVDTGLVSLLGEMRAIERAAAEQLGQLSTQVEFSGAGGGPIEIKVEFVRPADEARDHLKVIPGKAG